MSQTKAADEIFCESCGETIKEKAEMCPECGVSTGNSATGSGSDRTTSAILAILLGGIGTHKFYMGDTGMGILYLVFCWTFIPAIVGVIEGVIYLTKSDAEFASQY